MMTEHGERVPSMDDYLTLLGSLLRMGRRERTDIEEELRDHITDRVTELTESGLELDRAVSIALAELGDAARLAANFTLISRQVRRRRIMRATIVSTAIAATLIFGVMWLSPGGGDHAPFGPSASTAQDVAPDASDPLIAVRSAFGEDERNKATQKLLATTDTQLNLPPDSPLSAYVEFWETELGIQIYVDTKGLELLSVSVDDPINLRLHDIPAEMGLRLALEQLELAYYLDNGVVIVTAMEEAEMKLDVRIYDVSRLLALEGDGASYELRAPSPSGSIGGYGGGFGSRLGSGGGPAPRIEVIAESLRLIAETIAPDTWDTAGGFGHAMIFRNALIVRQSEDVHRQLESFLGSLESVVVKEPNAWPAAGYGGGYTAASTSTADESREAVDAAPSKHPDALHVHLRSDDAPMIRVIWACDPEKNDPMEVMTSIEDFDELKEKLPDLVKRSHDPGLSVNIQVAPTVLHSRVTEVIALCTAAGVKEENISLAVRQVGFADHRAPGTLYVDPDVESKAGWMVHVRPDDGVLVTDELTVRKTETGQTMSNKPLGAEALEYTNEELVGALKENVRRYPQFSVIVRADQNLDWSRVKETMDLCKSAGVRNVTISAQAMPGATSSGARPPASTGRAPAATSPATPPSTGEPFSPPHSSGPFGDSPFG